MRYISAPRVVEEMRQLYDRYGAEMGFFKEDLCTLNKRGVLELFDLLEGELPGKIWGATSWVDTVEM